MLTQNNKTNGVKNVYNDQLTCDVCSSENIIETIEGFVCKDCGIVLEVEKLEYHRPYSEDSIQYAKLNDYTCIGSSVERFSSSSSFCLQRLQRQQKIVESKKAVEQSAKIEVSRIFSANNYPVQYKDQIFSIFKSFRKKIKERSKYRSVDKLVPLSIYFCLKLNSIPFDEVKLLEVSKITKKDFNAFKLKAYQFLPQYKSRNREEYVLRKIFELTEHFNLGMDFYYQSKKILFKLWSGIKNTSDLCITGLVSAISILCSDQKNITVYALCNHLGVKMSSVQFQVKNRIFNRFKVGGFVSLIKSSDVLKKIMVRLGLIEIGRSEVKLGNAVQVFNYLNDRNYYIYVLKINAGNCSILFSKGDKKLGIKMPKKSDSELFGNSYEVKIVTFCSSGSGPPIIDPG